jgi:hypothetical protein
LETKPMITLGHCSNSFALGSTSMPTVLAHAANSALFSGLSS